MANETYNCEKCGAKITLWPGEREVFCRQCGAEQLWFPRTETSEDIPAPREPPPFEPEGKLPSRDDEPSRRGRLVPIPDNLNIDNDGRSLTIRRRWFTPGILFLVFFCIAWDSFLVFWYSIALGGDAPWIMAVFPIIHVAVGVGLTYFTVASIFNTTTIRIERRELSVDHGPIPWSGNRRIPSSQIQQLYCKEKRHRSGSSGGTTVTYEVCVLLENRKKITLMANVTGVDEALAIEQAIEQYLELPDEAVAGEVKR